MNTHHPVSGPYFNSAGEYIHSSSGDRVYTLPYGPSEVRWRPPPIAAKPGTVLARTEPYEAPEAVPDEPEPALVVHVDLAVFRSRWWWRVLGSIVVRRLGR
jgi:hypothetical protein